MTIVGAMKCRINSEDSFKKIESRIIQVIKNSVPEFNSDLSDIHHYVSSNDINALRLMIFKELNQNKDNYNLIWKICADQIISIIGPDVLAQSKINFSIQMPGDEGSVLGVHSDCWSGDSAYQVNVWIPFTNCFSSNSMFLFDLEKSKSTIEDLYRNLQNPNHDVSASISKSDFLELEYGNYLIFNPALLHGNILNETDKTRCSINIRYKSPFTPNALPEHISRSNAIYYNIFKESEWTRLSRELSKINYPQ